MVRVGCRAESGYRPSFDFCSCGSERARAVLNGIGWASINRRTGGVLLVDAGSQRWHGLKAL